MLQQKQASLKKKGMNVFYFTQLIDVFIICAFLSIIVIKSHPHSLFLSNLMTWSYIQSGSAGMHPPSN